MSYIGKQPTKAPLTASDIEDGIITAAKIEDGAVVAAEIASNAVTTAKINADAVTGAKIADDAINSEHYTDGSVDTAHIADANVTTAKIADDAITAAKLNNDIISGTTALASEPADTDEFLVSDAGTLKRIDYSLIKSSGGIISSNYAFSVSSTSTTSTSFISTYSPGIAVTPASTSSKFLVIATGSMFNNNGSYPTGLTLFRDSTNLAGTTSDDGDMVLINDNHHNFSLVDLDAPNTTSQVTYIMKYRATNSNTYARINANNTQSQLVVIEF